MSGDLHIPESVATCPDCDSTLTADVYEWDGETERPTGWHLWCDNERANLWAHVQMYSGWKHPPHFIGCERSFQENAEMHAAVEGWLDTEYPNPEFGDVCCETCGSESVGPSEVRDSKLIGTLVRCRSCILKVAPELIAA